MSRNLEFSNSQIPVFILFQPQLGENIGAVARAMSNFGLTDLRIVGPRDGWPNPAAEAMAAGGANILKQATLYENLATALHDITHLYATSARNRAMDKPVLTPRELFQKINPQEIPPPVGGRLGGGPDHSQSSYEMTKTAILFGPERSGLSNEEIVLADGVVTIPVSEENPSLNLAQSAVIMGYEWFTRSRHPRLARGSKALGDDGSMNENTPAYPKIPAQGGDDGELATKGELSSFFEHLKPLLEQINYFREENKVEQMWLTLRHIFTRMQPTSQELRTLRGLLRSLLRKL